MQSLPKTPSKQGLAVLVSLSLLFSIAAVFVGKASAQPVANPPQGDVNPHFYSVDIESDLTVGNAATIGSNVAIEGTVNIGGDLNVGNNGSVLGGFLVGGDMRVEQNTILEGQVNTESDLIVGRQLDVAEQALFHGELIAGNNFTTEGVVQMRGDQVIIESDVMLDGTINGIRIPEDLAGGSGGGGELPEDVEFQNVQVYNQLGVPGNANFMGILDAAQINLRGVLNANMVEDNGSIPVYVTKRTAAPNQSALFAAAEFGGSLYGAYIGHRSSMGMFDIFATGISQLGSLIVDSYLYVDSIMPQSGVLEVNGEIQAPDIRAGRIGSHRMYEASIGDGETKTVSIGCDSDYEVLVACSGYSNGGNYQGAYMEGDLCTAERTGSSGTLMVQAYCFNPAEF